MTEVTKATVRANMAELARMIGKASLKPNSGEAVHSEVYMSVSNDGIEFLESTPEDWVVSYSTFDTAFFDSVDVVQKNLIEKNEGKVEAIINVEDFLTYLDRTGDPSNKVVEVALIGNENDRLCHKLRFEGTIFSEVMLPASESNMEEIPLDALSLNDDEIYSALRSNGETMDAIIETSVQEMERIIDFVDDHGNPAIDLIVEQDTQVYPITVQDNRLLLTVGKDDRDDAVWGELMAKTVDGPDLLNVYPSWFEKLFNSVSGDVLIKTGENMPLYVVQKEDHHAVRHILRPLNEATE